MFPCPHFDLAQAVSTVNKTDWSGLPVKPCSSIMVAISFGSAFNCLVTHDIAPVRDVFLGVADAPSLCVIHHYSSWYKYFVHCTPRFSYHWSGNMLLCTTHNSRYSRSTFCATRLVEGSSEQTWVSMQFIINPSRYAIPYELGLCFNFFSALCNNAWLMIIICYFWIFMKPSFPYMGIN